MRTCLVLGDSAVLIGICSVKVNLGVRVELPLVEVPSIAVLEGQLLEPRVEILLILLPDLVRLINRDNAIAIEVIMGKLSGYLGVVDCIVASGSQLRLINLLVLVLVNAVPLHPEVSSGFLVIPVVVVIARVTAAATLIIFRWAAVLPADVRGAELLVDGDISVAIGVPRLEGVLWVPVIVVRLEFFLEGDHLVFELSDIKLAFGLIRAQKTGHVLELRKVASHFVVVVQCFFKCHGSTSINVDRVPDVLFHIFARHPRV